MRLLTFARRDRPKRLCAGAMLGQRIVDLATAQALRGKRGAKVPHSVRGILAAGQAGLDAVKELIAFAKTRKGAKAVLKRADVVLAPVIPDPVKFLCVGKNYRNHLEELKRNDLLKETPTEPTGFIKLNSVLVGDDAEVERPDGITTLDYEPELTFVIGTPGYRISKEDAMKHVAGVTLLNDLSAREIQKREVASGTRFWTAKNMPGFGPVGPALITLDEIGDPHDLWVTLAVNGEQRMRVHTGDLIFKIPDIIAHFSRYMPLEAGDIFATGAPGGVAVGQPNAAELYLKPGDVVDVAYEGIMRLRTRIIAPRKHS